MSGWIITLLTSLLRVVTTASARHLGIAAGWILLLAGLLLNSMATLLLGGAVVFFCYISPAKA